MQDKREFELSTWELHLICGLIIFLLIQWTIMYDDVSRNRHSMLSLRLIAANAVGVYRSVIVGTHTPPQIWLLQFI
jgi:hypothetical protein